MKCSRRDIIKIIQSIGTSVLFTILILNRFGWIKLQKLALILMLVFIVANAILSVILYKKDKKDIKAMKDCNNR